MLRPNFLLTNGKRASIVAVAVGNCVKASSTAFIRRACELSDWFIHYLSYCIGSVLPATDCTSQLMKLAGLSLGIVLAIRAERQYPELSQKCLAKYLLPQ